MITKYTLDLSALRVLLERILSHSIFRSLSVLGSHPGTGFAHLLDATKQKPRYCLLFYKLQVGYLSAYCPKEAA